MALFDTNGAEIEALIAAALALVSLTTLPFLLSVMLAVRVMRYFIAVREFGTGRLTSDELVAMSRRHPILRALSFISTLLALILGALLIQAGYMAEVGCSCTPIDFSPSIMFN